MFVQFNYILFPIVLVFVNIKFLKKIGEPTISSLQKTGTQLSPHLTSFDRFCDFKQNDT